jgi:hypothetical protein
MNQSGPPQSPGDKKHAAHDADPATHNALLQQVKEQYQANDYKLEIAGEGKSPRDFYGKALLKTGDGEHRKIYFKLDGRQRIPTIIVLNGQQLAKREVVISQRYRVYVPGGQQVATLREEG